jgi:flagellar motor component MotA
MDLTTLIGLIIGFGGVIGGFILEGGHFGSLFVGSSGAIVMGGTIGAVTISFGYAELKTIPGFLKAIFTEHSIDFGGSVEHLVETADRARREGLLSLESHLSEIDNDFMRRGLQLVITLYQHLLRRPYLFLLIDKPGFICALALTVSISSLAINPGLFDACRQFSGFPL